MYNYNRKDSFIFFTVDIPNNKYQAVKNVLRVIHRFVLKIKKYRGEVLPPLFCSKYKFYLKIKNI